MDKSRSLLLGSVFALTVLGGAVPAAFAQESGGGGGGGTSTAISTLKSQASTLKSAVETVIPIAVSSVVFGAGALLFKRFIYS